MAHGCEDTPRYGLLGRTLGHTYSPRIYELLAGITGYERFEREPGEVEQFLREDTWQGLNVTIPYKRTVMPFLDELSESARRLGNANTIVRLSDGRLRGDNTDYFGFKTLVQSLRLELAGKRALVFGGHGGAGTTCMAVLADLGMEPIAMGRTGEVTYEDLPRFADAALAVNATPAGMYPSCPGAPCTLDALPHLEAVVDIVYNPARTGLMMEAERRGIPVAGGLLMLVAQAAGSLHGFTGEDYSAERIAAVTNELGYEMQNIALIGMPGAGKTRVGQRIAQRLGREHIDLDWALEERLGCSCSTFITERGEAAFRREETALLGEVARRGGIVLSCGGGVVTRAENYPLLHQNSRIVMLDRPLGELSSKGRPVSQRDGVQKLAEERMPRYRSWADVVVTSRDSADATARAAIAQLVRESQQV